MAFISKLLALRSTKNTANNCKTCESPNTSCLDEFALAVEQVQLAVFRECDFRGRKLLFDSKSVSRVNVDDGHPNIKGNDKHGTKTTKQTEYVEVSNGFGYNLGKPHADISQLAEMVFGSVSITFRGTLYKIHILDLPPRLMFSQVFPCPRVRNAPNQQSSATSKSVDNSMRLNDSAGSSQTSYSTDQSNSDYTSMGSDTWLICRRRQFSAPLDVPLNASLISSSGYGGELSTSSLSSGPLSMSIEDCCRFSNSYSEQRMTMQRSLPTSVCLGDDIRPLRHRRTSKLGLAVVLELSNQQEKIIHEFLMHHIAIIESILKRIRQEVEIAYVHHHRFVSCMFETSLMAARWFVELLTVTGHKVHLWQQLNTCDIPISIKCDTKHLFADNSFESGGLRSFTKRLFKMDKCNLNKNLRKCDHMERFLKDLCELVEKFDVKHTNFTLMTGVLTHHLGWVATLLPKDEIKCSRSANLMVRQLCDLYGCVGNSGKVAHTIIVGQSDAELINKFINVLTYFIRCSEIEKLSYECKDTCSEVLEKICNVEGSLNATNNIPQKLANQDSNLVLSNQSFQLHDSLHTQATSLPMKKRNTCVMDLSKLDESNEYVENSCQVNVDTKVLFLLGADERLEKLNINTTFSDYDFVLNSHGNIKPSQSSTHLPYEVENLKRAQSEQPTCAAASTQNGDNKTTKYRYSGVKFNFNQHPQIFENYMKSKNIEMPLHKNFLSGSQEEYSDINFSKYVDADYTDDDEPLQTPSNATELEYTSDLILPTPNKATATAIVEQENKSTEFVRRAVPNTVIIPANNVTPLIIKELPMLPYNNAVVTTRPLHYTTTLIRSCSENYIPNMALQGLITACKDHAMFKKDLSLSAKYPFLGEPVEESIAIIGNIDSWTVSLISSHTYVIDKAVNGIPIGMSQLVANMLETLLHMWKLHTPPEYCLMHIEQKLREFCVQSKALARMLLDTEYCSIDLLTSTLKLEVNDVPLLMAVAAVHTPEVTKKYGLRFQ